MSLQERVTGFMSQFIIEHSFVLCVGLIVGYLIYRNFLQTNRNCHNIDLTHIYGAMLMRRKYRGYNKNI